MKNCAFKKTKQILVQDMKNTTWEFYFFLMVSNNACKLLYFWGWLQVPSGKFALQKRKCHLNRNGLFTDSSKKQYIYIFLNQRNHLKSKWGGSNTHKSHLNILFCWFLQNTVWMPVKSTPSRLGSLQNAATSVAVSVC